MILNFFACPDTHLANAKPQSALPTYYPQRLETDGWVDWTLSQREISRICRALTKPYPGMRTVFEKIQLRLYSYMEMSSL